MSSAEKPHRIRLRGSWEHPDGSVGRLRRSFGKPTNLAATDTVQLVFRQLRYHARIWLNAGLLGEVPGGTEVVRFSVQNQLQPRNLVEVERLDEVEVDGQPWFDECWLEIDSSC